jgi:SAM-dependent methyltransferase
VRQIKCIIGLGSNPFAHFFKIFTRTPFKNVNLRKIDKGRQPTTNLIRYKIQATMGPKGVAEEGQLVARPPIHPASFDSLHPEKLNHIFLYYEDDERTPSSKDKDHTGDSTSTAYRYKLTVVDRPLLPTTTNIAYTTAVFLIPAGRESEYMFTSHSALQQIAASAQTARLIAVAFGRGHDFVNTETVQQELTYVVQVLSRQGAFLPKSHSQLAAQAQQKEIPFLAMDGIGERNVIAQGETVLSGQYLVEQVRADDRMVRRLYFMDNPLVIQSEVALLSESDSVSTTSNTVTIDADTDAVIDKSHAAFDYHKQMAAGVLALAGGNGDTTPDSVSGLMVGLGGGGLVNFLQYLLALDTNTKTDNDSASTSPATKAAANHQLMAIELDPAVVQVAKQYFGVTVAPDNQGGDGGNGNGEKTTGVRIRVGNGLFVCAANDEHAATLAGAIPLAAESLDFLVIDVDSKDKTVGMSCPPVSFVETEYLQQISRLLKPGGVLAINVSARDPAMLQLVCQRVQTVFATVFLSQQDADVNDEDRQDVNVVLFALKETSELPSKSKLVERLENFVSKERVDGVVFSDLEESLDDLRLWNVDADASNSSTKNAYGKKKPKKNKKRGKRK